MLIKLFFIALPIFLFFQQRLEASKQHACSTYGTFKYPEKFKHFDYVNPKAPKGRNLRYAALGTFNTLNGFVPIGDAEMFTSLLCVGRLLDESKDEFGSAYAYIAEFIEISKNLNSVTFFLNKKAQFDNGQPITAYDVEFSFNALREHGIPMFRSYYKAIKKIEIIDKHTIKFLCPGNKSLEIALILGQLPVLSKEFFKNRSFKASLTEPMPSSGPYRIKSIDIGQKIVFERITNWWGEKISSQVGQYNPSQIQVTYFRDPNAQFEAFKAGQSDIRFENQISRWMTGYNLAAVRNGNIIKQSIQQTSVAPTYGFFFNTRRDFFSSPRVREAITLLFNFEWINKQFFYHQYERNLSYFDNSQLAAKGKPSDRELAILKPYKAQLDPRALTTEFKLPIYKKSNDTRYTKRIALELLKQEGWELKDQKLTHKKTKKTFQFTVILSNKITEKVALHLKDCLSPIGIDVSVRLLDVSSYQNSIEDLNYDMVFEAIPQSHTLGNEQREYFGSSSYNTKGTRNHAGIHSKAIDEIIEKLIAAPTLDDLHIHARALDRALLWGFYHIPAWHGKNFNLARTKNVHLPKTTSVMNPLMWALKTLWIQESKTETVPQKAKNNSDCSCNQDSLWKKLSSWFKLP